MTGQKGQGNRTKAKPNPDNAIHKKLNLAIQAGKERDYKKALLLLEQLASQTDAPAEAGLLLGRTLHALKDYSRALACYNDYSRIKPDSPEGYFFAGRSYLSLGMPGKAVPLFRKAGALNPDDMYNQALLGTAYLKSRHSQLAADTLQNVVETAAAQEMPEKVQARFYHAYINALFIRGINLCRNDNYELGGQMLAFVLANGGDNILLRLELGRACRQLGKSSEALEHYNRALESRPDDPRILWYRASILMAMGKQKEALEELQRIRELDSSLPDLPWNSQLIDLYMIRSFLETNEWRRSADCSRLWIKQYGHDPLIHAMYAEAQRNLRNYTSAFNHLKQALQMEPKNINLLYEQLMTAWESGDTDVLEKSLRNIKKISGEDDIYRRFNILLKAKTTEDTAEAISLLQKAILNLGPEPELMCALGENYLKTGLTDLALNWFKKTITVQKNHEKAWLGCISALEVLSTGGEQGADDSKGLLSKAQAQQRAQQRAQKRTRKQEQMRENDAIRAELHKTYDEYLKYWPDNFQIRRDRALYLIHIFEYPQAVSELEALLAWEPSNFHLRRVLAYGYRKTGRYREAAVYLRAMLKERPHDTDLLLEYSGCLERSGSLANAISVLEKAGKVIKHKGEINLALGLLYARAHNTKKAFAMLMEAAVLNKKDPRPYKLMASLAAKNGNKAAAAKYRREAEKRSK
ncbi:MAG: tetratricopeptide repeat protein [Treponema sp.]|nr:tetratricopeptide repeat protein [Treponema sp.]